MRGQKNRLYYFTLVLLFFVSVLSVTFGILMYRTNLLDTYGNLMRARHHTEGTLRSFLWENRGELLWIGGAA